VPAERADGAHDRAGEAGDRPLGGVDGGRAAVGGEVERDDAHASLRKREHVGEEDGAVEPGARVQED
jgi:hypothetical protein